MKGFFRFLLRTLIFLLYTAVLLAVFLLCVVFVLEKGPSPAAADRFVQSLEQTQNLKFVSRIFLTEEEVQTILTPDPLPDPIPEKEPLPAQPISEPLSAAEEDEWAVKDPDGDGIILETIRGNGYLGYMMIVRDPSRVILGYVPGRALTTDGFCKRFGAVAGINAGGFADDGGHGSGNEPTDTVISQGVEYKRTGYTATAGFDAQNILHVGYFTRDQFNELQLRDASGFGPILVCDGVGATDLRPGVNPRTAIGQRADGAVLLLAIEGRQVQSIGATLEDLVQIMLDYGAVNALNLDGGASVQMWYDGSYVNAAGTLVGLRNIPDAFIVLPQKEEMP